jgi:nitrate reductase NapE component
MTRPALPDLWRYRIDRTKVADRLRLIGQAFLAVLAVLLIGTFGAIVWLEAGCRI